MMNTGGKRRAPLIPPQNRAALPDADFSQWVPPEAIGKSAAIIPLLAWRRRAVHGAAFSVYG